MANPPPPMLASDFLKCESTLLDTEALRKNNRLCVSVPLCPKIIHALMLAAPLGRCGVGS